MGQNFMVSREISNEIVARSELRQGEIVLEIGPGLGALTNQMRETGAQIYAVEKDQGLASFLRKQYEGDEQVTVVEADILDWDLRKLPGTPENRKVVANLPYGEAIPILFKLLEPPTLFRNIHIMVQKEVADRMTARPGTSEYGLLTVHLALVAIVERVLELPPAAFYPPPAVISQVVRITPVEHPPYDPGSKKIFEILLKAAFGRRRKILRNALAGTPYGPQLIEQALSMANIEGRRRGETLSLEEFCRLSRELEKLYARERE
jgi:16S rRNA (adenine1518-N6/adenine1519-N6)-dimethyltransferase